MHFILLLQAELRIMMHGRIFIWTFCTATHKYKHIFCHLALKAFEIVTNVPQVSKVWNQNMCNMIDFFLEKTERELVIPSHAPLKSTWEFRNALTWSITNQVVSMDEYTHDVILTHASFFIIAPPFTSQFTQTPQLYYQKFSSLWWGVMSVNWS